MTGRTASGWCDGCGDAPPHRVRNACPDRASISIHVYGANIGAVRRSVYAPDGTRKPFISGYSNAWVPNLWDRSREPAAR